NRDGPIVLPMSGDVGSQYTPCAGWAQAIQYHSGVLHDSAWAGAIGVVLGGEASVATNGFWSALTMATTLELPMLFYIEDNGLGQSAGVANRRGDRSRRRARSAAAPRGVSRSVDPVGKRMGGARGRGRARRPGRTRRGTSASRSGSVDRGSVGLR